MLRRSIAALVLGLFVLLVPQITLAVKASRVCGPGFDLGALTLGQGLQLPNIQAALADGVIDVATLTVLFEGFDANDDGLICPCRDRNADHTGPGPGLRP